MRWDDSVCRKLAHKKNDGLLLQPAPHPLQLREACAHAATCSNLPLLPVRVVDYPETWNEHYETFLRTNHVTRKRSFQNSHGNNPPIGVKKPRVRIFCTNNSDAIWRNKEPEFSKQIQNTTKLQASSKSVARAPSVLQQLSLDDEEHGLLKYFKKRRYLWARLMLASSVYIVFLSEVWFLLFMYRSLVAFVEL